MRLPIEWLKEYVEVPSGDGLRGTLEAAGVGVESIDDDTVDLEVTPNRGDWLSVIGISREVAAMTGRDLPKIKSGVSLPGLRSDVAIKSDPKLCPRFGAVMIEGVSAKPSSNPVQKRLKLPGIRPINSVVDVTNYLMLETGQPFHAFDLDKIRGQSMTIRSAKKGERLTTLDEKERILPEGSIIIEDAERIIDLAGIMGGENSAVDEKTTKILLQAAIFDPVLIRRASKKIGLKTEASYRYERGVDWNIEPVLSYGARVMTKLSGGKVAGSIFMGKMPKRPNITLPVSEIERLLGTKINADKAEEYLSRLGFVVRQSGTALIVVAPSWRNDVSIPEDLVEEVARLYGYEKIRTWPMLKTAQPKEDHWREVEQVKDWFAQKGFQEVLTYPLVSKQDVGKDAIEIQNPLSPSQEFFRTSIIPGLLRIVAKNSSVDSLRVFEIGRVATKKGEQEYIAAVWVGPKAPHPFRREKQTELNRYKVRKDDVWVYEDTLEHSIKMASKISKLREPHRFAAKPLPKFPAAVRDLSIVVPESKDNEAILSAIQETSPIVFAAALFDEFTSDKFGKGMKSLAFHITYQSSERTLTDREVNDAHKLVEDALKKQFTAKVRGVDIP